jgi:hypothetical protein
VHCGNTSTIGVVDHLLTILLARQHQQIGELGGDPPGFVRRPPSGLLLEVEIAERLPVLVAHDEAGVVHLVDSPGWREAASAHSYVGAFDGFATRRGVIAGALDLGGGPKVTLHFSLEIKGFGCIV